MSSSNSSFIVVLVGDFLPAVSSSQFALCEVDSCDFIAFPRITIWYQLPHMRTPKKEDLSSLSQPHLHPLSAHHRYRTIEIAITSPRLSLRIILHLYLYVEALLRSHWRAFVRRWAVVHLFRGGATRTNRGAIRDGHSGTFIIIRSAPSLNT